MNHPLAFPALVGAVAHALYRTFEPRALFTHFFLAIFTPISLSVVLKPRESSHSYCHVLSTWAAYLTTLIVCTIGYRLSPFHPLAKYPGPLLCKISKSWLAFVSYQGKQHLYCQKLHKQYGDIVRTGPNELSFCAPEYIPEMMGASGLPKAAYWDGRFWDQKEHRTLVGRRDPQGHARLRRIWSRGFTSESLRAYSPMIDMRLIQLLEHLGARVGQTIDLAKWISWCSYDVMNDMAFGDHMELMQTQDAAGVWSMMEGALPAATFFSHVPWLGDFVSHVPSIARRVKKFRKFSRQRVWNRMREGSATRDILYHLIDEGCHESERPAVEQVANDAVLVTVAGSDTVSLTISSLCHLLICNPASYQRLQDEIDRSNLNPDDVVGLTQLPYLNAAINEALRIFPPVPSGSPRSPLIGSSGATVRSHFPISFIPEGTTTCIHTYTMQRDERNFAPFPERFLPERWLPSAKQIELEPDIFSQSRHVVHNTTAFMPFSYGPADCIGKKLAMQEMRAMIFGILQRFSIRFANGYDKATWEADMLDFFVIKKPKLSVVLSSRVTVAH